MLRGKNVADGNSGSLARIYVGRCSYNPSPSIKIISVIRIKGSLGSVNPKLILF